MGKRFIFLGPPGAGKGTQAALASHRLGVPVISTGGIFRQAISEESAMGKQISQFVNAGLLVPDKLTNAIVAERIQDVDCASGFILDGYPRSLVQAKALDAGLAKIKQTLDRVLFFKVDADMVIARMSHRRICNQCGVTYNLVTQAPKVAGKCDKCNVDLVTRSDDQPDAIRKRLDVYEDTTRPLLKYYEKRTVLTVVNASMTVSDVESQVQRVTEGA